MPRCSKSAEHVAALGSSSQEIGQIVDAIDDIASQTNLLALNAAIEAATGRRARQGLHGGGSRGAQAGRAVQQRDQGDHPAHQRHPAAGGGRGARPWQVGSSEVEKSATLGQQASAALASILGVVEETHVQAAAITEAVSHHDQRCRGGAGGLRARGRRWPRRRRRQPGRCAQGALRVQASVESIAAVGEQSAAGAEEVSASTEEQSASAEQMSAGAQELAALATGLKEVVDRFTLDATETTRQVGAKQNIRAMRVA